MGRRRTVGGGLVKMTIMKMSSRRKVDGPNTNNDAGGTSGGGDVMVINVYIYIYFCLYDRWSCINWFFELPLSSGNSHKKNIEYDFG